LAGRERQLEERTQGHNEQLRRFEHECTEWHLAVSQEEERLRAAAVAAEDKQRGLLQAQRKSQKNVSEELEQEAVNAPSAAGGDSAEKTEA